MIHRSRETGVILHRLGDRLLQDPITELYYVSTRGKLGPPLVQPPPSMMEPTPVEPPIISPRKEKTKTVGKVKVPHNLIAELTSTIGVEQIPLFLRYLKEMINMHPIKFITQNRGIRTLIETEHFPAWLVKIGAA